MTAQKTEEQWLDCLNRVEVTGGSNQQKKIFYSSLYHSLIKPCGCRRTGKNAYDPDNGLLRDGTYNRFEGFNNEPDMETPVAYVYAGRHDRTAEIIRAGMRYMFTSGRGGLPGNNDSGGLSSCYVWNAIGLFPVSGQPVMLIGSPIFDSVTMRLPRVELTVITENNSDTGIYVREASFNGKSLNRAYLTMDEFLGGGVVKLQMSEKPCGWATHEVPPSFG